MGLDDGCEVGMLHSLLGGESVGVVVAQKLVQKIDCLRSHQVLVVGADETLPSLARMPKANIIIKLKTG